MPSGCQRISSTRVAAVLLLLGVGLVVGLAADRFTLPTVVVCGLLVIASLTWYSSVEATRVAIALLLVTPFIMVVPQFRPDQINYYAYCALALSVMAAITCVRARRIALDSGAVLLAVVLVSAVVTLVPAGSLTSSYGYLLWPVAMLAMYLLMLNSNVNNHVCLLSLVLGFSLIEAALGISQSLFHWPVFSLATPTLFETNRGVSASPCRGFLQRWRTVQVPSRTSTR